MSERKAELRKQFRLTRAPNWRPGWDRPLIQWLQQQPPGIWGAYCPLADEAPILETLKQVPHLSWVYPVVSLPREGDDTEKTIHFHRETLGWHKGPFSVEPILNPNVEAVGPTQIQGLLIPALAFDVQGYRLGRGGGFYDRYLKAYLGMRVGVIHSSRILKELPHESFDQRVGWLATEVEVAPILGRR